MFSKRERLVEKRERNERSEESWLSNFVECNQSLKLGSDREVRVAEEERKDKGGIETERMNESSTFKIVQWLIFSN